MKPDDTFVTLLTCMDGRFLETIFAWIKKKFGVKFPDTITEPGMDKLIREGSIYYKEAVMKKVMISIDNHCSRGIVICGHEECAGNPVPKETHIEEIREFCKEVSEHWGLNVPVFGLWIDLDQEIKVVYGE